MIMVVFSERAERIRAVKRRQGGRSQDRQENFERVFQEVNSPQTSDAPAPAGCIRQKGRIYISREEREEREEHKEV
jgi:hypothetical protein